ncbi:MAG TPA: LLM class F420-dependent oxidoreductase [Streptosporangiaceae bacterium]|nr:LLM class F420-dependent oxidoreductase [Streptosporangiaceae bacterium]
MSIDVGKLGIWRGRRDLTPELAATVEGLGYGAIWIGGSPGAPLDIVNSLLDATERITVATGIVNMWADDAAAIAQAYHHIVAKYPRRFLLGVGIGHPEATDQYRKPYDTIVDYLDKLDAEGVPVEGRVLAALGPRVLRLTAERAAGAHPYLVTPDHTREARAILGPDRLLAPEQKVVLETDPVRARAVGRPKVKPYLGLVNYVNNLRRIGWTDEDLADDGSDRLIDALVLHGSAETVAQGITAHLEAGADHVAVQVLNEDPVPAYRALADVLLKG